MLSRWLHSTLDMIFPPRCSGCGRVGWRWCAACEQALAATATEFVTRRITGLDAFISTGSHSGQLRLALRALKYDGAQDVAQALSRRLVQAIMAQNWRFDTVIPVPLHSRRQAERGYNQAKVLAVAVANHYGLPLLDAAVIRQRPTRTQVGLNRQQRIDNVAGAFITTQPLHGHAVLLVDDVRTTGATISACAQALRNAGANPIYGITVTHATPRQQQ